MSMMKNESAKVNFLDNARFKLELPGFVLDNCRSLAIVDSKEEVALNWEIRNNYPDYLQLGCINSLGEWLMDFSQAENRDGVKGVSLSMSVKLNKFQPHLEILPIVVPEMQLDHLLSQGAAMGRCRSVKFPQANHEDTALSGCYILMLSRGELHLQISTPVRQKFVTTFTGKLNTAGVERLAVSAELIHGDFTEIKIGPVEFFSSAEPFKLMEAWGEANTETQKDFSGMVKPGWNSWDYYRWTITEEEVLKNAEFIAADPVLSKHVKRIIVDDGWQYCYGEWEANPLFPNGMGYLAKELTKMGFEPGLWFAPTIVEPHCRIAQLDYDMLAMSEGGQPCMAYSCMERVGFVLDPTVPKVQKHLYDLFDRYAGMGYKYFKLDFLASTLKAKQFHDRTVSRGDIIRKIVEPVAKAVEGRSLILGCNYNFNAGNQYVDAVRIGSDIHSTWKGINHNVVSVAARYWSNKRWWINDPDFALARSFGTSNDPDIVRLKPCLVYCKPETPFKEFVDFVMVDIEKPQSEMLLSIVLMAAGAVNLSDNMPKLNAEGVELARRVVAAESAEAAVPLDLFESDRPAIWLQKTSDGHRVLLINWQDENAEMEFCLNTHGVTGNNAVNFWNDQPVDISSGKIRAILKPRSCLLTVIN